MAFRASIFGSCVSRDLVAQALPDFSCLHYVARQSLISSGHAAEFDGSGFQPSHAFVKKSFESDIRGDGIERILGDADKVDALLWDIIDERLGVFVHEDGSVITRSNDAINTSIYDDMPGWTLVPFGSQRHLAMFAMAATLFARELDSHGLKDRTFFISTPWATAMKDGQDLPPSAGLSPQTANEVLPHYEEIISELGINILRPEESTVLGDPDHVWGPAAYHYIPKYYESLAQQINDRLAVPS